MKTATKPIFQNQNLCNILKNQDSGLRYVGIKGSAPMVDLSALLNLPFDCLKGLEYETVLVVLYHEQT